jgi:hypothetical protein
VTATRLVVAVLAIGLGAGLFFAGRSTASHSKPQRTYRDGYLAGREAAFGNYDGGWGWNTPWIVVLGRGGPGITYRVARRWSMQPGFEYRLCGSSVCERRASR